MSGGAYLAPSAIDPTAQHQQASSRAVAQLAAQGAFWRSAIALLRAVRRETPLAAWSLTAGATSCPGASGLRCGEHVA